MEIDQGITGIRNLGFPGNHEKANTGQHDVCLKSHKF
jgi:hypothetical protein